MARILLIDDDAEIRSAMRLALEHVGHDVMLATDWQEGINAMNPYRAYPARVIIVDIMLPDKSGLDLLGELRPRYPEAGIIAISADPEYLRKAARYRADRVLLKPFKAELLLATVEQVLQQPRFWDLSRTRLGRNP